MFSGSGEEPADASPSSSGGARLFIEAVELRDFGWGALLRARQEMLFGSGSRAIYRRLSRSVAVFLRWCTKAHQQIAP